MPATGLMIGVLSHVPVMRRDHGGVTEPARSFRPVINQRRITGLILDIPPDYGPGYAPAASFSRFSE
jgi:hypothetical protein